MSTILKTVAAIDWWTDLPLEEKQHLCKKWTAEIKDFDDVDFLYKVWIDSVK